MHHTRKTAIAGTTLAAVALTFSSLGVAAGEVEGIPDAPTGYPELDQALAGDLAGTKVIVQTQYIEGGGEVFAKSLAPFEAATGIDIQLAAVPGGLHETQVNVGLNGGSAADIIQLAQPATINRYGADGLIKEIGGIVGNTDKLVAEQPVLGAYTDADGNIWAIPYQVGTKSHVWYPIKAFEAAGYEVPTTWDELIELSDQIVAGGSNPWCISVEHGAVTGWVATDWVEDVLLRTAGVDAYNAWLAGELPFDSPELKEAFETVGQIFFTPDYAYGGNTYILNTWVGETMDPMFDEDLQAPSCWMQKQANWYGPTFFPDYDDAAENPSSKYVIGEDIGLFYLPGIKEEYGNPLLGSSDAFMVTTDRPEVRAMAQFLATPEAAEAWIKSEGILSANSTTPPEWFEGNYKLQVAADIVAQATSVANDASDSMPPSVGGGSFLSGMVDWISAGGENTDEVLQSIDATWPTE